MLRATDTVSETVRLLPNYIGVEDVILFFVVVFLLTAILAIVWLVSFRGWGYLQQVVQIVRCGASAAPELGDEPAGGVSFCGVKAKEA
jgi:hypothetical protein